MHVAAALALALVLTGAIVGLGNGAGALSFAFIQTHAALFVALPLGVGGVLGVGLRGLFGAGLLGLGLGASHHRESGECSSGPSSGGCSGRLVHRETLADSGEKPSPPGKRPGEIRKGPPHPLSSTVAPFRAWRSLRCAVGGPIQTPHRYPMGAGLASCLRWVGARNVHFLSKVAWGGHGNAVLRSWHTRGTAFLSSLRTRRVHALFSSGRLLLKRSPACAKSLTRMSPKVGLSASAS